MASVHSKCRAHSVRSGRCHYYWFPGPFGRPLWSPGRPLGLDGGGQDCPSCGPQQLGGLTVPSSDLTHNVKKSMTWLRPAHLLPSISHSLPSACLCFSPCSAAGIWNLHVQPPRFPLPIPRRRGRGGGLPWLSSSPIRLPGPLSAGRRGWFVVMGALGSLPALTHPYVGTKHAVCTCPGCRVWPDACGGWPASAPLVKEASHGSGHQELILVWILGMRGMSVTWSWSAEQIPSYGWALGAGWAQGPGRFRQGANTWGPGRRSPGQFRLIRASLPAAFTPVGEELWVSDARKAQGHLPA